MPLLPCVGQQESIIFNEKTNKFELSLQAGLDQSSIASEWERLEKEVKRKDSIILAKSKTIKDISELVSRKSKEIDALTKVVVDQNEQIQSISNDRVSISKKTKSLIALYGEINTEPYQLRNIEFASRAVIDFNKIYFFAEGSVIVNQDPRFDFGGGVKIF